MRGKYWVYYKEQCKYCLNRGKCGYTEKVQAYIEKIEALDSSGIYGTTAFWCDYYNLDEDEYLKYNGECASQG